MARCYHNTYGVDISPSHIDYCKRAYPEIADHLSVHDAARLPFPDKSFDTAILSHVVEHHPLKKGLDIIKGATRVSAHRVLVLWFIPPSDEVNTIEIGRRGLFYENRWGESYLRQYIASLAPGYKLKSTVIPNEVPSHGFDS